MISPGQFLEFKIREQFFAVPIGKVAEILRMVEITKVPQTETFVAGVMNLRGKVVPVIDLRMRLGFQTMEVTKHTCILVVDSDTGSKGMIVDAVVGVQTFAADQLDPPSELTQANSSTPLLGVGKTEARVTLLLDLGRVFVTSVPAQSSTEASVETARAA